MIMDVIDHRGVHWCAHQCVCPRVPSSNSSIRCAHSRAIRRANSYIYLEYMYVSRIHAPIAVLTNRWLFLWGPPSPTHTHLSGLATAGWTRNSHTGPHRCLGQSHRPSVGRQTPPFVEHASGHRRSPQCHAFPVKSGPSLVAREREPPGGESSSRHPPLTIVLRSAVRQPPTPEQETMRFVCCRDDGCERMCAR